MCLTMYLWYNSLEFYLKYLEKFIVCFVKIIFFVFLEMFSLILQNIIFD